MDHTEDFLPARDFQSVEIQNRILKKSVYHVRFVEKMWFFERQKKEENITDVKIIQLVNLCHGKSHLRRNVQSVEAIWWKKAINCSVQMKNVGTKQI